jgi:hypothetical protein
MKPLVFIFILLFCANTSWALRCQGSLMEAGDSQDYVEQKCGDPKNKETLSTTQVIYNASGIISGSVPYLREVWTYQASPQDFIYRVYFTEKVITLITTTLDK